MHNAPIARRPAGFEDNIPPWYDDPVVWGTMGDGYPVFQQPAHAAPQLHPHETKPYSHADTFILLSKYLGAQWVNAALIDEEDRGL